MNYDPFFLVFLEGFVFKWECVFKKGHYGDFNYVISENDPNDPGGLTKWGIDQRSHPTLDIEHLTQEQATEVYWNEFQNSGSYSLPRGIREAHFDAAVNSGESQSTLFLQRSLNLIEAAKLSSDGELGPKTIRAAAAVHNAWPLISEMLDQREIFYRNLANRKTFSGFLPGWLNRVADLRKCLKNLL